MGISLELVDFDDLFYKHGLHAKKIINDFSGSTEEEKEEINRLIYTKDTTGLLSNLPTCECGKIVGEFNMSVVCNTCHTPVQSLLDQELETFVWIRTPQGVRKLINPIVWTMLSERFTKSGFEIIRWLCDTNYRPVAKMPPIMEAVLALNIERGYNNFIDNFQYITDSLFNLKGLKVKKGLTDPLQELLRRFPQCVFSDYLPIPNRSLLVIEQTNVGTYVDPVMIGAVDAIQQMVSIDSVLSNFSVRTKENRTVKTIAQLAEFYDGLYRSTLAKKEGIFRKHIFGTRSHFSFRAVISSITVAHDYDELHIPWGVGISVFRIHLMNKLLRANFTPNEAIAFLNEHAQKYNPHLAALFEQLINESPYPGVPCVLQRNPSLERGSAQALFITKVKEDIDDPTVSLSNLILVSYNADFDGKQLLSLNFFNCWETLRVQLTTASRKTKPRFENN
jgi:hypothetical protein